MAEIAAMRGARAVRSSQAYLYILAVVGFVALLLGQVEATRSDSFGTLVISQSLVQNGTVQLDKYHEFFLKDNGDYDMVVQQQGGHLYPYFPLGVPVLSTPVVALANLAGFDMRSYDSAGQRALAAAVGALTIVILTWIAALYFPPALAALLGVLGFFGTVIGPTMGMALWSIDYEIALVGLAAIMLLNHARGRPARGFAWLLGVILFFAYLCRPTAAAVILPTFGYLLLADRRSLLITAATSAALLVLFMGWSWGEYGTSLPPYYAGSRLSLDHIGEALWGAFLSPSRNLLIFNPFLVALALFAWKGRHLPREKRLLPLTFLAMGAAYFLINISAPDWSGIWSYGPRLYTTMVFVSLISCLCLLGELRATGASTMGTFLLTATLTIGAAINLPGLYNPYTWYWNAFPDAEHNTTQIMLDWRFPQFATTRERLVEKYEVQSAEYGLPVDQFIPLRGNVLLSSWTPERQSPTFTWLGSEKTGRLRIYMANAGLGVLSVAVNGHSLGDISLSSGIAGSTIMIPPSLLSTAENGNRITYSVRSPDMKAGGLMLGYSLRAE